MRDLPDRQCRTQEKERSGCVLIDFAVNAHGKVMTAPYSVRPTAEATVSMPLPWRDFENGVPDPTTYTIRNVPDLVGKQGDVLAEHMARGQRLPD